MSVGKMFFDEKAWSHHRDIPMKVRRKELNNFLSGPRPFSIPAASAERYGGIAFARTHGRNFNFLNLTFALDWLENIFA